MEEDYVINIGISPQLFWTSTLRELSLFSLQQKRKDDMEWNKIRTLGFWNLHTGFNKPGVKNVKELFPIPSLDKISRPVKIDLAKAVKAYNASGTKKIELKEDNTIKWLQKN